MNRRLAWTAFIARRLLLPAAAALALAWHSGRALAQPAIDAEQLLRRLYAPEGPARLWSDTDQARQALELLRAAPAHGLDPSHYVVDALSSQLDDTGARDAVALDRTRQRRLLIKRP